MTRRPPFAATSAISAILVIWLGVSTLSWATSFFNIWTAEEARRINVLSDSSSLPTALLLSNREESRPIIDQTQPFVILDFIYTRCPTVCNTLGFKFKQLQDQLIERNLDKQVEILSISFDLRYDSPQALSRYLTLHKADNSIWSALVPESKTLLETLKQRFGVVVIDDEFGGYTHNAAIYVIENGKLKKIFNDDDIDSAISYIEANLSPNHTMQASR